MYSVTFHPCLYVLICENLFSRVCVCLGSGVDVGLWREGGSSHRPDWLPGSPAETTNPPSPPTSAHPCRGPTPDSTQHPRNKHKLPLFPSTWLAAGCARRLVENPCLYRNHNTVDLQRETPAHARTTQNITDHLLNTEIEPHCNVKVWGYGGLAQTEKKFCSYF